MAAKTPPETSRRLNRVQFETRSTNLPRSPRGGEDLNWNLRVSNWTRFSRIRAYTFAKACRERGLNAEVLSFFDHLGAPGQGSAAYRMDEQSKLRLAALGADVLKINRDAIFYMQKVSYHSLSVAIAAGANGNPVVLDYDDFDFQSHFLPRISRFLP